MKHGIVPSDAVPIANHARAHADDGRQYYYALAATMRVRPISWWQAPLAQWLAELRYALLWQCNPDINPRFVARIIMAMNHLERSPTVERMLRQHLGSQGAELLSAAGRRMFVPPYKRELLSALNALPFDYDFRIPPPIIPSRLSKKDALAIEADLDARSVIDRLPSKQRYRLGAAGFLLLVTAIVAARLRHDPQNQMGLAKAVAVEILLCSRWLYGRTLPKVTCTLVDTITKATITPASIRWLADHLPPE
jgi:hypothetical protein